LQKHKDSKADEPWMEFTGAEGRTSRSSSCFDAFEDGADATVDDQLKALTEMAKVKQQDGPEATGGRRSSRSATVRFDGTSSA
jgi:hypothetical protein